MAVDDGGHKRTLLIEPDCSTLCARRKRLTKAWLKPQVRNYPSDAICILRKYWDRCCWWGFRDGRGYKGVRPFDFDKVPHQKANKLSKQSSETNLVGRLYILPIPFPLSPCWTSQLGMTYGDAAWHNLCTSPGRSLCTPMPFWSWTSRGIILAQCEPWWPSLVITLSRGALSHCVEPIKLWKRPFSYEVNAVLDDVGVATLGHILQSLTAVQPSFSLKTLLFRVVKSTHAPESESIFLLTG